MVLVSAEGNERISVSRGWKGEGLLLKLRQAKGRREDVASSAELLCSDGGKLRRRIVRKPKPRRLGLAKVRHSAMKRLDSVRLAEENEAVAWEVSEDSVDLAGGRRRGDGEKVARGWRS